MKKNILIIGYLLGVLFFIGCGGGGSDGGGASLPTGSSHWAKSYSTGIVEYGSRILQTNDGGYLLAGTVGNRKACEANFLVIKLDSQGNINWQKIFDREGYSEIYVSTMQTKDGGYIVAGNSACYGNNALIIKLDSNGNIIWQKTFTLSGIWVYSIQQTGDGGYILGGDVIMKLDSSGNIIWQNTYNGGGGYIEQTKDGGYIVVGIDSGVVKLDANGGVMWAKKYEGEEISLWEAKAIHETADGGYIFGGGLNDLFIARLDSIGNIIWSKAIGGSSTDDLSSIQLTRDGGYIVVGDTQSFGAGFQDIWVLKLNKDGEVIWQKTYGGISTEYGESIIETNDGDYVVSGTVASFGDWDLWMLKLRSDGTISPSAPSYLGADTDAEVKNISITASDISVTPVESTITAVDSSVKSIDANTMVQTQASD